MKHLVQVGIVVLSLFGLSLERPDVKPVVAHCQSEPRIMDVVDSYVEVQYLKGADWSCLGSAVIVAGYKGEQFYLTCAHVAETEAKYKLRLAKFHDDKSTSATWPVKVAYISTTADVAVLIPTGDAPPGRAAILSDTPLSRGEPVWYCGSAGGYHAMLERSVINTPSVVNGSDGLTYFAVNGNGWFGDSGCGVYVCREGRLVMVGLLAGGLWNDARSPCRCVPMVDVRQCLKEWKK